MRPSKMLIVAGALLAGAAFAHTGAERLEGYSTGFNVLLYELEGHRAVITSVGSKWLRVEEMTLGAACAARPAQERADVTGDGVIGMPDWVLFSRCLGGC